jgi:hypothetical protein
MGYFINGRQEYASMLYWIDQSILIKECVCRSFLDLSNCDFSCYSIFSFMCMFCRSSFWPLCCLFFFDLRILITPLVSSNFFLWQVSHYYEIIANKRVINVILTCMNSLKFSYLSNLWKEEISFNTNFAVKSGTDYKISNYKTTNIHFFVNAEICHL